MTYTIYYFLFYVSVLFIGTNMLIIWLTDREMDFCTEIVAV